MADKKKIKATELTNADALFISLVPKGANRIPFRILKKDGKMDLGGLFTRNEGPFVASVVVSKDADTDAMRETIVKQGFSIETKVDSEDHVQYIQKEIDADKPQCVVKVNDDMGILVQARKAMSTYNFETTSFSELYNTEGVMPSLDVAKQALSSVFYQILFGDAADPDTAADQIQLAVKEFGELVTQIVQNVPVSAFSAGMDGVMCADKSEGNGDTPPSADSKVDGVSKTEKEHTMSKDKALKDEEKKVIAKEGEEDKATQETEEKPTEGEDSGEEKPADDAAPEADKEEEADAPEADAEAPEAEGEEVAKKNADIEGVLKAVELLTQNISKLQQDVESLSGLPDRVEEIAKIAKSADEAVQTTTLADAPGDVVRVKQPVVKKASALVDTGYTKATI